MDSGRAFFLRGDQIEQTGGFHHDKLVTDKQIMNSASWLNVCAWESAFFFTRTADEFIPDQPARFSIQLAENRELTLDVRYTR